MVENIKYNLWSKGKHFPLPKRSCGAMYDKKSGCLGGVPQPTVTNYYIAFLNCNEIPKLTELLEQDKMPCFFYQ